ncbi:uncharacterized protein [Cardiocondyla obscurior]|uniref:uncharacterized protein n=1 Tax=Cardiocondyla obscurior TaxID=286306 RepID=UPI0039658876
MDKAKKIRSIHRRAFSKALNTLNALCGTGSEASRQDLIVAFELLEEKVRNLEASTQAFLELLFDSPDATDEEIQKELDDADQYKGMFIIAKSQITNYADLRDYRAPSVNVSTVPGDSKRSYKLPKIEISKFSGDIRDWLQFWSLFKKIHEDADIVNEDKFQYLIQAMGEGNRAAKLVKSYPPTAEYYGKVINSLKNRFGREDLLIEVYVRELLQLVLQNTLKSKSMSLASLYDKIEIA